LEEIRELHSLGINIVFEKEQIDTSTIETLDSLYTALERLENTPKGGLKP
jgi:hypothetical protein